MAVTTDYLAGLSDVDRETLESWLFEFDRGWTPGRLSESFDTLSGENNPLRMAALTEMVKVDMERQFKAGRKRLLEEYLSEFSELGTAETVSPDLIQTEYVIRKRLGERIDIEDYSKRFPQQIRAVKKLLREIQRKDSAAEKLRQTSDTVRPTDTADSLAEHREFDGSVPRQIGRYRILRKLGEGAMGAVYLALDEQLDRQVALKTPTFSGDSAPELIERFYREARSAATIRHPNICPVYDVGEIDGTHYITMAYIEGRPMSDYITRDQRFPQRGAALIIRKIAIALQDAHQLGVVHRDLKPANIMIDQRREPLVMDFGLAQRTNQQGEARLTQSGMILGTPAYMSPEQVTGDLDRIGPCCDIYSLGVILYELLTGELPFEGSIAAVIGQILTKEPRKPSALRPDIDPKLEAICLKMLAKKIEDRTASMQDADDDLRDYLKGSATTPSQTASAEKPSQAESSKKTSQATPSDEAALFAFQESEHEASRKRKVKFPTSRKRKRSKQKRSKQVRPKTLVTRPERRKASGKQSTPRSNPLPKLLGRLKQIPPKTRRIAAASAAAVLLLLGIVLLVQTDEGTLRIEINDPNISVAVNGKQITITDGTTSVPMKPGQKTLSVKVGGTTIDLGQTIRLTADGRKVAIQLGNAKLTGKTFTIVKGNDTVLKVSLEPKVVPSGIAGPTPLRATLAKAVKPERAQQARLKDDDSKKEVDLLALIPKSDQRLTERGGNRLLIVDPSTGTPQIDYDPPEEYDYHLEIMRSKAQGHGLYVRVPVGNATRKWVFYLDGYFGTGVNGIDGTDYRNSSPHFKGTLFRSNRVYKLVIKVRRTGVALMVDEKTKIDWKGHFDRLPLAPDGTRRFGFGVHKSTFEITKLRVVPVNSKQVGPAVKPERNQKAQPTRDDTKKEVDLLALIPKTDQRLTVKNGNRMLTVDPNTGGVPIYYDPPEEYDFHLQITRRNLPNKKRGLALAIRVPVGDGIRRWVFYLNGGKGSGVDNIDGAEYQNSSPHFGGVLFRLDRVYELIVKVRRTGVALMVNGKTKMDWKGKFDRLPLTPDGRRRFGFGVYKAKYEITNLRVVPVNSKVVGPAKLPQNTSGVPSGKSGPASAAAKNVIEDYYAKVVIGNWKSMKSESGTLLKGRSMALSPDGLEFVFSRSQKATTFDLYVARRKTTAEPFGDPKPLKSVRTGFQEGRPGYSADGRTLFFRRWSGKRARKHGTRTYVWKVNRRANGSFTSPQELKWLNPLAAGGTCFSSDGKTTLAYPLNDKESLYLVRKSNRQHLRTDLPRWLGAKQGTIPIAVSRSGDALVTLVQNGTRWAALAMHQGEGKYKVTRILALNGSKPAPQVAISRDGVWLIASFDGQYRSTQISKEFRPQIMQVFELKAAGAASKSGDAVSKRKDPWPLDQLSQQSISEGELQTAALHAGEKLPEGLVGILGDSRLRHWSKVGAVDTSSDGSLLVSSGFDAVVTVWNPATGRPTFQFNRHRGWVLTVSARPAGSLVASGGVQGEVYVWNPATGKVNFSLPPRDSTIRAVAFDPSGKTLAVAGDIEHIELYDAESGKEIRKLSRGNQPVYSLDYSPDGATLASGGSKGTIKLWDAATGELKRDLVGHGSVVKGLSFSKNGAKLASGSYDRSVRIWNVETGEQQHIRENVGSVRGVALEEGDGRVFVVANRMFFWPVSGGGRVRHVFPDPYHCSALAINHKLGMVIAGGDSGGVSLWPLSNPFRPALGSKLRYFCVDISPDGRWIAAGGSGSTGLHLMDATTLKRVRHMPMGNVTLHAIAFSPDGKMVAAAASSGDLSLRETSTGQELYHLGGMGGIRDLAFSPDGKLLAVTAKAPVVHLFDAETGDKLRTLEGHDSPIGSLAFNAKAGLLVSAGGKQIKLWDLSTFELRSNLVAIGPVSDVTISPDGKLLATALSQVGAVKILDLSTMKLLRTHQGFGAHAASVSFSPDGQFLATSGGNGTVRLWLANSGEEVETFQLGPKSGSVDHVRFAPDGRHLITTNANGTIYVLRLTQTLNNVANRSFSSANVVEAIPSGTAGPTSAQRKDDDSKKTVDLLALIPKSDQRLSNRNGKRLLMVSPTTGPVQILNDPPEEYDYHLKIIRRVIKKPKRNEGFFVHVPAGNGMKKFLFRLDGKHGSGLDEIDGQGYGTSPTNFKGILFRRDRAYELLIKVRRTGVELLVGGKTIIDWKGKFRRLPITIIGKRHFGFISHVSRFEITEMRVAPVNSKQARSRSRGTSKKHGKSSNKTGEELDVLKQK